jgi:hypothetical protein
VARRRRGAGGRFLKAVTWLDVKAIRKAVREASINPKMLMALEIEREAKQSMEGGRIKVANETFDSFYRKTGRRRDLARAKELRVPSKPGTPPNVQTGVGRGSIKHAWLHLDQTAIVGPSSPPASYMSVHEFGGRFHPPRPFMRPAMLKVIPRYPKLYKNLPLSKTKAGRKLQREQKTWMKKHGGK